MPSLSLSTISSQPALAREDSWNVDSSLQHPVFRSLLQHSRVSLASATADDEILPTLSQALKLSHTYRIVVAIWTPH